jgi:hypothetical protein
MLEAIVYSDQSGAREIDYLLPNLEVIAATPRGSSAQKIFRLCSETDLLRPTSNIGPDVEAAVNAVTRGGEPLPLSLRTFFEPRFGYDFSQ